MDKMSPKSDYIYSCLKDLGFNVIQEFKIHGLPYDYYVPERRLIIEYDSMAYYSTAFKERYGNVIERKTKLVREMGYRFLRINYTLSLEQILLTLLIMTQKQKYARYRIGGKFKLKKPMKNRYDVLILKKNDK